MLFDPLMHLPWPVPFARSIEPTLAARHHRDHTPARQHSQVQNKHKLVASIALQSQHDQICGTQGSLTITKKAYVHIYRARLGHVSIPPPFCESAERAKSGADETVVREEYTANIDGTTTRRRPSSRLRHRHWRREEKGF